MSGGGAAFTGLVDLASARLGGRAVLASDAFFAPADNLVRPEPPRFDPDAYTERGKEMDGWESRRRRTPGHDWAIVALGVQGRIRAVDVDTSHFLGNHAPYASVDAAFAPGATAEQLRDEVAWVRVVPQTPMRRGSSNLCAAVRDGVFTHVRLNIYPDGGVARLRVYGEPEVPPPDGVFDLAALAYGGRAVACSDAFFSPMEQLILPGRSRFMGDGWETRRSRPPGADWIAIRLATTGIVERIEVDTHHFKGNFPDRLAVDGIRWPGAPPAALRDSPDWEEVVPLSRGAPDTTLGWDVGGAGPFTHLRVRIVPDGGLARFRALGRAAAGAPDDPGLRALNALGADEAGAALARCCAARRWVAAMVATRPFASRAHLFGEAEQVWWHLDQADWLQAFAAHPRIGDRAAGGWSRGEQAGVAGASAEVLERLARGNAAYEERFGHVYLVCATGLSADQMLARLEDRLGNPPEVELRVAAGEQARITRLRLEKLLQEV